MRTACGFFEQRYLVGYNV